MRYGMVIDTSKCIGCHTCSVKCKIENNVPKGIWWNQTRTNGGEMMDTPDAEYPNGKMSFYTIQCQHCEDPACTKVCPVGATHKDPETGIVHQDYDRCIGCRICMASCPYSGVRSFNWDEPAHYVDHDSGASGVAPHQKHTVEKCTMCSHRTSKGEEPACVGVCLARARHWGDLDDPNSEVSKLVATGKCKQLLPEKGTNPSVYYMA